MVKGINASWLLMRSSHQRSSRGSSTAGEIMLFTPSPSTITLLSHNAPDLQCSSTDCEFLLLAISKCT
ncbi:hypothetical protein J6590_054155 [Homalodisca vitripennis]|nr:hypothetical protein J6590_054155 [Homalodisca vitripennis]